MKEKDDGGGDIELFGIDANSNVAQLTNGTVLDAATGHTFLAGGMLMQWEKLSASSGSTVVFQVPFTAPAYSVQFMVTGSSGTNRIFTRLNGDPTDLSFSPIILNSNGSGITETIYYVAIGTR